MSLGQQQAQVNAIGGDHIIEVCGANPNSINFVGNAQHGGGHQNYGNSYNPVDEIIQTFLGEEIKINRIVRTNIDPKGMRMAMNNRSNEISLVISKAT
ncbi:hypothetical protein H5410_002108 [Solanum commersonii]|uniref:Uncharacterized protein n=1 Tax=Solanum commersonii TaxID=4109 RepID=A0A9J6B1Y6_SOLCO|nr:hypothetical protein H5410_002108 [Solanum commersonii]